MKSIISFIVIIMIGFILISCSSTAPKVVSNDPSLQVTSTEGASILSRTTTPLIIEEFLKDNQLAHKAYEDAIKDGELSYMREYIQEYSFYDIDDNGVDELITLPLYGAYMFTVYNFCEGKANNLGINNDDNEMTIYPENQVISFTSIDNGRVGSYTDVYYQIKNEKTYLVAMKENYENDFEGVTYTKINYYVNDNETTEDKFAEFIKTLCTGKYITYEDMHWCEWVSPEFQQFHPSYVHQIYETEIHCFRFNSNANDSVSFRFEVDKDGAKLQNMEITLCDLDFEPVSMTESFGTFEQMDYQCAIPEEGGYYLKVVTEFEKSTNHHYLHYDVVISDAENDS